MAVVEVSGVAVVPREQSAKVFVVLCPHVEDAVRAQRAVALKQKKISTSLSEAFKKFIIYPYYLLHKCIISK